MGVVAARPRDRVGNGGLSCRDETVVNHSRKSDSSKVFDTWKGTLNFKGEKWGNKKTKQVWFEYEINSGIIRGIYLMSY